ncbi:MAG TPA: alpha/beta fold hydrolase [Candidatus Margulisiibacteriota bacterium]|nr:alpha/beta fold hydrolase [Candidatus Margulisiibacteriota bacterium]
MSEAASAADETAAFDRRASIEFARTTDGWDLALHHYQGMRSDLPPAILVSGYACNRYFMDFDDHYSLARFLARRGIDAWVLELRGHGHSEVAVGRQRGWTFDDLVRFDVPAAITHVRAQAGGRRLVWIGHSMGGMIAYAALGLNPAVQDALAGLVPMASPMGFPPVSSPMMRTLGEMFLALPLPSRLPQRGVLVALWSVLRWSPGAAQVGMNPANIDPHAFGRALRLFMSNVPRSKLRQLAQWSLSGEFRSCDGSIDYRANLSRINTPALIIAGAADRLASPEMVRFAHDRISSAQKRYREFGVRSGDSADYGHVDLIFGRRAPDEVFPVVGDWIEHIR